MNYYNEPQGFFDRLTMIGPDDALIDYTSRGNYYGVAVIPAYFANWIPHFLWPDKPGLASGNLFAHEIGGIVAEDDYTTGISFTPVGRSLPPGRMGWRLRRRPPHLDNCVHRLRLALRRHSKISLGSSYNCTYLPMWRRRACSAALSISLGLAPSASSLSLLPAHISCLSSVLCSPDRKRPDSFFSASAVFLQGPFLQPSQPSSRLTSPHAKGPKSPLRYRPR